MKTQNSLLSIALTHDTLSAEQEQACGYLMQKALQDVLQAYRQNISIIRNLSVWLIDNPEDALLSPSTMELTDIVNIIDDAKNCANDLDKHHRYQEAQQRFMGLPLTFDGATLLQDSMKAALKTRMDTSLERSLKSSYRRAGKALSKWEEFAEIMISSNLKLIMKQAASRSAPGMTEEDIFQDGVPGLRRAVEKWDVTRGLKFSTYAVPWIKQSIGRAIKNKAHLIRIPVNQQGLNLHEDLFHMQPTSLQESKYDDDEFGDFIPDFSPSPESVLEQNEQAEKLKELLGSLSQDDRNIIALRYGLYGEAYSRNQTAGIVGLKESQIRHIEQRSLAMLSESAKTEGFHAH